MHAKSETAQVARERSSNCLRRVASEPVERDAPPARSIDDLPHCLRQRAMLHEELARAAERTARRLRVAGSPQSGFLYQRLALQHRRAAQAIVRGERGECPRRCERE